jgi:signal transduction histidine kinase
MLKTLPLAGWQVVLGEVLAPVSILVGAQWLLLLVALMCSPPQWHGHPLPLLTRLGIFFAAALLLAAIDFITLLIRNFAVMTFPAWFHLGKDGPRGFENTGQQLILLVAQTLALALALLPPAALFVAAWLFTSFFYNPALAVAAAVAASLLLFTAEAVLAVRFLGRIFERFDLSKELLLND